MKRLVLLSLFLHQTAFADLIYVPKWHMTSNEACYGIGDAKTLVTLDSKLVLCAQEEAKYPSLLADQKAAYDLQVKATLDAKQNTQLWTLHAMNLTTALEQCEIDKAKAQDHSVSNFGWIVAGALVLVGLGIGGGVYLSKH